MTALPADLWDNQRRAVEAALEAIAQGRRSGLWVMATGTGKTRATIALARLLGIPTGVLVHRDILVRQWVAAAAEWWPEAAVGVIQADRDEWRHASLFEGRSPDLVVASVQSLHPRRLAGIPRDRFGFLVSDEAHRSVAKGWSRAIEHFQAGFHLGVTATPDRLDGVGLAKHFGSPELIYYGIKQAIEDGVLVHPVPFVVKTGVVLDNVKKDAHGKWDVVDLSKTVSVVDRNRQIVGAYRQWAQGRLAVAFCVDVDHVHDLTAEFNAEGIPAVAITGLNPEDRERDLNDFRAGKYRVAVNCEVMIEGADIPAVSCILWARPTKSKLYYLQGVGRGLRRAPGKLDCLIIDFVDASKQHKLVTLCNLFGIRQAPEVPGKKVLELLGDQEAEEAQAKEKSQQRLLAFPLVFAREDVSPWPDLPSLRGYEPTRRWHTEPATERQIKALRRLNLEARRDMTRGEASWLFDRAREYDFVFPTPATGPQERYLRREGKWTDGLSRREASRLIGALKAMT